MHLSGMFEAIWLLWSYRSMHYVSTFFCVISVNNIRDDHELFGGWIILSFPQITDILNIALRVSNCTNYKPFCVITHPLRYACSAGVCVGTAVVCSDGKWCNGLEACKEIFPLSSFHTFTSTSLLYSSASYLSIIVTFKYLLVSFCLLSLLMFLYRHAIFQLDVNQAHPLVLQVCKQNNSISQQKMLFDRFLTGDVCNQQCNEVQHTCDPSPSTTVCNDGQYCKSSKYCVYVSVCMCWVWWGNDGQLCKHMLTHHTRTYAHSHHTRTYRHHNGSMQQRSLCRHWWPLCWRFVTSLSLIHSLFFFLCLSSISQAHTHMLTYTRTYAHVHIHWHLT